MLFPKSATAGIQIGSDGGVVHSLSSHVFSDFLVPVFSRIESITSVWIFSGIQDGHFVR